MIGEAGMNFEEVQQRVVKTLNETLCNSHTVTNTSTFAELDMDSLDEVEFVMSIEDEFGLEVPDHVAQGFKGVADTVNWLVKGHE